MQVDGAAKARRPDPSKAAGQTWLPMSPAPEAGVITHPVPRGNPRTGRINPFPFLRMTEPAGGTAATWRALHRKQKATAAPVDGIRRAGTCIDSTPGACHGDMERDARRCRPFNRS
jgi:hypothetical protein